MYLMRTSVAIALGLVTGALAVFALARRARRSS
jgi:hypothetical protein